MSWSGIPYAIEAILGERKKRDEIRDKAMKKLRASTTGDRTMTEIEKKAREIANGIKSIGGIFYRFEVVEAARLGILKGLETAAKWHDDQSKIHHKDANAEWADSAAEKVYRRRANEHTNYAKQLRALVEETER